MLLVLTMEREALTVFTNVLKKFVLDVYKGSTEERELERIDLNIIEDLDGGGECVWQGKSTKKKKKKKKFKKFKC